MVKKQEMKKMEAENTPDPVDELITERLRKLKDSYEKKGLFFTHLNIKGFFFAAIT